MFRFRNLSALALVAVAVVTTAAATTTTTGGTDAGAPLRCWWCTRHLTRRPWTS